jgi:hypothetical protein
MTQALPLPPLEVLQEKFEYNPETGELRYKKKSPKNRAGDIAGYPTQRGWLRVKVCNTHYRVHRIAWKMFYGEDPPVGMDIDHINRVKTDNRIVNLRIASRSENVNNTDRVQNKKPPKPRSTPEELAEIRRRAARKGAEKSKKSIVVRLPNGEEKWYPSVKEAAVAEQINAGNLSSVLNGRIKSTQGYTARYAGPLVDPNNR